MKQERSLILIDGSNFYFKLKDLGLHKLDFDYSGFVTLVAGESVIVQSTYFVGEVRTDGTEHTQKLYNNQQKLIARLKKHHVRISLAICSNQAIPIMKKASMSILPL